MIAKDMTVGEMAAREPKSMKIFKEVGIDFCCDGKDNLCDALAKKKMSEEQFSQKLDKLKAEKEKSKTREVNFLDMTPDALAEYIVTTHHEYLRKALPETYDLFLKVLRVHGVNHPELYEVFKQFGAMKIDLDPHLIREEVVLFPEISDRGSKKVIKLAKELHEEHENVAVLMEKIREINHNYTLPSDACMSFKGLYQSMQEIEEDIHQHIHLENNILFKGII